MYFEPYNEATNELEKVYYLGGPYRTRISKPDEKLKQDWGKSFSLDEANKIIADLGKLEITLNLEKV